jgi:fermentation-respiration switch protein FrsA (DUF1100 family)
MQHSSDRHPAPARVDQQIVQDNAGMAAEYCRNGPSAIARARFKEPLVIHRTTLPFFRGDLRLVGELFRNTDRLDIRQPGVIVTGSWLTVKEQMPEVYATELAERGYTALTFDFAGFGKSGGDPRQAEIPDRKIADLVAAADFLATLSFVEPDTLTHLAICASAQYGLAALARGSRVSRFVSVAGWYHDPVSVAAFYGGATGVADRLEIARAAIERNAATGVIDMVPAYKVGDQSAGMFFELDYYANPARGAVAAWKNQMATMSWCYWLAFDGLRAADRVSTAALLVHSDGCVFPDNLRSVHARLRGPKQLVWTEGGQTDFYDQRTQVEFALNAADQFLKGAA